MYLVAPAARGRRLGAPAAGGTWRSLSSLSGPGRLGRRRSPGATSTCSSSQTSTLGSPDTRTRTTRDWPPFEPGARRCADPLSARAPSGQPLMPTTVLCSPSTSGLLRAPPRPAVTCSSCRMATSTTARGSHGYRRRLSCPSSRRCPSMRSPRCVRGNPGLSPGPSSSRRGRPDLSPSPSPIPGLPCLSPPRTPVAVQSRATMSCTITRPSSTSRALMASSTAGGAPSSLRTYSTPPRASR